MSAARGAFARLAVFLLIAGPAGAQGSPRFTSANTCALCHSQIPRPDQSAEGARKWAPPRARAGSRAAEGSIAPFALWSGTVMAHSSRDPYWRAKVRYELAQTPAAAELIEDRCLSCHAPQQQYDGRAAGVMAKLDTLDALGLEGVACTVCHQITPTGLGAKASFTAGFEITQEKVIYGPHPNPFAMPMIANSGYTPAEGAHILESALCGSCHTVITPTLEAGGRAVGEFVEQGPFLEWLRSAYPAEGSTCQRCHAATLRDDQGRNLGQYIAHTPGGGRFGPTRPRSPFGLHFFNGANLQGLGMFKELYPAEAEAISLIEQRTRQSLAGSLTLAVAARLAANVLEADVDVINRTGHKLPTGFPSRRLWLHVTLRDRDGAVLYDSGGFDEASGEIRGLGEGSAAAYEPHHDLITRSSQVAVYEAEMRGPDGARTLSLLRGAVYLKDNRILPRGYDPSRPLPQGVAANSIAPAGVEGDSDFLPGSDRVHYRIAAAASAPAPLRLTVEALYQSVKPSHAAAMEAGRSREEAVFLELYPRHRSPAVVSRQELVVGR